MDNRNASRTFEHFPPGSHCPLCGDSEDGECVLIGINGTESGKYIEAIPFHLSCLSNPKRFFYYRDENCILAVCKEVKHG